MFVLHKVFETHSILLVISAGTVCTLAVQMCLCSLLLICLKIKRVYLSFLKFIGQLLSGKITIRYPVIRQNYYPVSCYPAKILSGKIY